MRMPIAKMVYLPISLILSLFILSSIITTVTSTILRFRLLSGEMIRMDVDDENTTIKQCYQKLVSLGKVREESEAQSSSSPSKFQIRGDIYQILSDTSLQSLNLKNGEIINYLSENILQKSEEIKTSSSVEPATSTSTASIPTTSSSSSPGTRGSSNLKKKTIVSMASIEARKKELEKITRQKSSKLHTIYINPVSSMERIFNRIATHGGLALLLGNTESIPSKPSKRTSTSTSTSPIIPKKIIMSSSDNENVMKNVTSVEAICEIFISTTNSVIKSNTATSSYVEQVTEASTMLMIMIQQVMKYAQQLGLEIIGCCINTNNIQNKDVTSASTTTGGGRKHVASKADESKSSSISKPWSSDHVYTASFLQNILLTSSTSSSPAASIRNNNSSLIVLSVSKCGDNGQIQSSASASKTGTISGNKLKASVQNGLSIEAFKFSDQAVRMIQKGILPSDRSSILSCITSATKSTAASNYQKKNAPISASTTSIDTVSTVGMVQLCGDVLLKNDEVKQVDPLLLAVPLSIVHKAPTHSTGTATTTASSNKRQSFQHSFPTPHEISSSSDKQTSILAQKYSTQLFQKLEKHQIGSVREKLRDIHLFSYLETLLDSDTVNNIAKCAVDENIKKLTPRSLMAIQMLSLSSKQNNGSHGGVVDDSDL